MRLADTAVSKRENVMAGGYTAPAIAYDLANGHTAQQPQPVGSQLVDGEEVAVGIEVGLPEAVASAGNVPGARIDGFHFPGVAGGIARIDEQATDQAVDRDHGHRRYPDTARIRAIRRGLIQCGRRTRHSRGSEFIARAVRIDGRWRSWRCGSRNSGGHGSPVYICARSQPSLPATVEDGHFAVTKVSKQPPRSCGKAPAGVVIGNNPRSWSDRPPREAGSPLLDAGERMATTARGAGGSTQILTKVGVACSAHMCQRKGLFACRWSSKVVAAVEYEDAGRPGEQVL